MIKAIDILFVDDQWCRPKEQSTIMAAYGALTREDVPFRFHYETAETKGGRYSVKPVMTRIRNIQGLGAVILDIMFGAESDRLGLDILSEIRSKYPTLPVIVTTSVGGDFGVLERAMELGANEYLIKKPTLQEMSEALRTYTQKDSREAEYVIWGNAQAMCRVRALIVRAASTGTANVLIYGETGTGKELVARAIHRQGPRRRGKFIVKNCAGIDTSLLDSELFGHEKGSFTSADRQRIGLIESANDGILFLDEIGSMSHDLQGKLLRVLETKEFQRVGGNDTITSDFQLICASNIDPKALAREGKLREDLYHRISQFPLNVPPLRERSGDIDILLRHFFERFKAGPGRNFPGERFSPEALKALNAYHWSGNVRQLRNIVESSIMLSRDKTIDLEALPKEIISSLHSDLQAADNHDILPEDASLWPQHRIIGELRLLVEAKRRIQKYKKTQWRAEFMRRMYPESKVQSAKGLNDLLNRLTTSPWGDPHYSKSSEVRELIAEMKAD